MATDAIPFSSIIMVLTEHSQFLNFIPNWIVQRVNGCLFGHCERWCIENKRGSEDNEAKWGLEFFPEILLSTRWYTAVAFYAWCVFFFLTFHLGPTLAYVLSHVGWKSSPSFSLDWVHASVRHRAWISVSKCRALRAKVDEAIQGCAVNIYPIILPPGFQNKQSAELLLIFPHLLRGRNLREAALFLPNSSW